MAELLAHVTRVARVMRETVETARENCTTYTSSMWKLVNYPMKPILFRKCRLEKEKFDGGRGNKIGVTLVAREACGKFGRNFDRHVDGQMRIFPAALCRGIEKLHGDGSYVLIGGQR